MHKNLRYFNRLYWTKASAHQHTFTLPPQCERCELYCTENLANTCHIEPIDAKYTVHVCMHIAATCERMHSWRNRLLHFDLFNALKQPQCGYGRWLCGRPKIPANAVQCTCTTHKFNSISDFHRRIKYKWSRTNIPISSCSCNHFIGFHTKKKSQSIKFSEICYSCAIGERIPNYKPCIKQFLLKQMHISFTHSTNVRSQSNFLQPPGCRTHYITLFRHLYSYRNANLQLCNNECTWCYGYIIFT